jgi:hypothetical protein
MGSAARPEGPVVRGWLVAQKQTRIGARTRGLRMSFWQWLEFIEIKVLPWAPIAAIIGVLAYDAFFVCSRFAGECRYPVDVTTWKADYTRGCAFGVRGLPTC